MPPFLERQIRPAKLRFAARIRQRLRRSDRDCGDQIEKGHYVRFLGLSVCVMLRQKSPVYLAREDYNSYLTNHFPRLGGVDIHRPERSQNAVGQYSSIDTFLRTFWHVGSDFVLSAIVGGDQVLSCLENRNDGNATYNARCVGPCQFFGWLLRVDVKLYFVAPPHRAPGRLMVSSWRGVMLGRQKQ